MGWWMKCSKMSLGQELPFRRSLRIRLSALTRYSKVCRTALGASDFREGLALDFEGFNASLLALGLEPETYPGLHSSQLKNFIHEHGIEISNCLRARYAKQLSDMQPVKDYALKRDRLRSVEPDRAWLLAYKEVPDDALAKCVNAWLAKSGLPLLGGPRKGLRELGAVREHNRVFLRAFAPKAMPLVRAWCAKFQPERPIPSSVLLEPTEALRSQLDNIGVIDFRNLDESKAMEWLRIIGIWPTGMKLSLDLGVLGLTDNDVTGESIKDRSMREARKREERSITLNGPRGGSHGRRPRNALARNPVRHVAGSFAEGVGGGYRHGGGRAGSTPN